MNAHQKISSKGGKSGRGESKARTSDQARKAARQRWINELSACELIAMHHGLFEYVKNLEDRLAEIEAMAPSSGEIEKAASAALGSTQLAQHEETGATAYFAPDKLPRRWFFVPKSQST